MSSAFLPDVFIKIKKWSDRTGQSRNWFACSNPAGSENASQLENTDENLYSAFLFQKHVCEEYL